MKRFASVMLMVCILAVPSLAATYYAAPGGTGTGKSPDSPATVVSAVALCGSGGTVQLADGTYTGPASMISLAAKQNMVVRAEHDGAVLINGEGVRQPVKLDRCVSCTVEGLDACNSNQAVVEAVYCYDVTFRRICAWDAAEGNNVVLTAHWSGYTTFEDCAGWGRGRKIMTNSQNCNGTRFIRCWGRWEGCISVGPKHVYEGNYNSYNCRFINCIGTWDTSTGRLPDTYVLQDYYGKPWTGPEGGTYTGGRIQSAYGIFAEAGYYAQYENTFAGTQFLGCMAYTLPGQTGKFTAGFFVSRLSGITVRGCHSSMNNGNMAALLAANDRRADRGLGLSARGFAHYGGSCRIDKEWQPSGIVARMPLPQTQWKMTCEGDATCDGVVDVGDLGVLSANWGTKPRFKGSYEVGDFNRDGNVDVGDSGILSANFGNAPPLWPWPMEERIAQAMERGGYPRISVTQQVQQAFGSTTMAQQEVAPSVKRRIVVMADDWVWPALRTNLGGCQWSSQTGNTHLTLWTHDSEMATVTVHREALRFSLSGLSGTVASAKLVLAGVSGQDPPHAYKTAFRDMTEGSLTWLDIMPSGTHLGAFAADGAEKSVAIPAADIQAALGGNFDIGIIDGAMDYTGNALVEDGSFQATWTENATSPRLVITFQDPPPAGPPVGTLGLLGVGR